MPAHILIDEKTGHMTATDDQDEPVAESRRHYDRGVLARSDWLMDLFALCHQTGIRRLEFLRGGRVEVVDAKEFFSKLLGEKGG